MHRALIAALVAAAALLLVACGDDDSAEPAGDAPAPAAMGEPSATAEAPEPEAPGEPGTRIESTDSEFGEILVDSNDQAIYIFENDSPNESACFGECLREWPPVLTKSEPRAGGGVEESLLGTIERPDGGRQVTYAGQPLYFYAHEDPGQVLCHDVDLNGGFWWVLGPDGERRP